MKIPVTLALAALVGATPVYADPPAHGYYKAKHYQGKSGAVYLHDYGIAAGHCDRDAMARSSAASPAR